MASEPETNGDLRAGQLLAGKYRIGEELGRGGMGAVYAAENIDIGRRVAIKVLRAELTGDPDLVDRFRREARAAVAIDHPGIVEILDVGEEEGLPFIVMELLSGESLRARIERQGRLRVDEALEIADEALDALEYAHRKGVVHRDLKPDNIFLVAPPRQGVKILDFGISKFAGGEDVSVTASGAVAGTPLYMPPEQAKGIRDVGPRGDLYALGAVLYHALSGKPPFAGDSFGEVIARVLTDPLEPIESRRSELPPHVARTINQLLARAPGDRPASAREARTALTAASANGVASAALDDTMPASHDGGDEKGADLGVAATAALGSGLGDADTALADEAMAVTATPAASAATLPAPSRIDRTSSRRRLLWLIPVVVVVGVVAVIADRQLGEKARARSAAPPPATAQQPDAATIAGPAIKPAPTTDAGQPVTVTLHASPAEARWSIIDPAPEQNVAELTGKARARLLERASPLPCDSSTCELDGHLGKVAVVVAQARGHAPAFRTVVVGSSDQVTAQLEVRRTPPKRPPRKSPDAGSDSLVGTNPLEE